MKSKFKVQLDIKQDYYDYDQYSLLLEKVTPGTLSLQCPHCGVFAVMRLDTTVERPNSKFDFICTCTHCDKIVFVQAEYIASDQPGEIAPEDSTAVTAIYPQNRIVNIPPEVPEEYRDYYRQAILILDQSPAASAALCRRILQNVIREEFKISRRSLDQEIDEFLKLKDVPSYLAESVDAVRAVGNFAAHPLKDTDTGEILEVEPGEAEWLIGVVEHLFDFAFVQPQKLNERKSKLNAKLKSAGKPELKTQSREFEIK